MKPLEIRLRHVARLIAKGCAFLFAVCGGDVILGGLLMVAIPGYGNPATTRWGRLLLLVIGIQIFASAMLYLRRRLRMAGAVWMVLLLEILVISKAPWSVRISAAAVCAAPALIAWYGASRPSRMGETNSDSA